MNREACSALECNPRKIGGAWAFTGTRVPVYALFENLETGATVKQVFGGNAVASGGFSQA